MPRTRPTRLSELPQPFCPPSTSPQISVARPPDTRIRAGMSRRARGPQLSERRSLDPMAATSPMGTLIQKIQCQSSSWVTAPPTRGPQATASPAIPPQIPTTAPRRSEGNAEVSKVRPSGMTIAAPMP